MISCKGGRTVSGERRAEIIAESYGTGKVVSEVARANGISPKTIYGWRRKEKERSSKEGGAGGFVEVLVEEEQEIKLKKASLEFSDIALTIEGQISSRKLVDIIRVLED